MRNWKADDGTTSIIIGPAKSQIQDKTKKEVEFKAGTIMLERLIKDEAQSAIGRAYAVAVDAAQAQTAQKKLVGELQIVDQEKLQKDKKQAELEKQLARLKVELQAISRQAENKEIQVKLQAEMKELEAVLSRLNKSNTASGQVLQNYIAVGRTLDVDRDKALLDLSKEQNQLRILLEESRKRGDEKQAVEFEKMINLFRVREDQAKAQADQAQRQYRVAATRARDDVAAEKQAQAKAISALNIAKATQAGRNYTVATPFATTSSGSQANDVLVIPSRQAMDAQEYKIAVENMQTMALILKKKLDMGATAVAFGMLQGNQNRIMNFTGSDDDVQAIYLEGYGALFLMTVDYPLLAPVEKKVEPKKKAGDDVWEKARQEIKGGRQGAFGITSDRLLFSRTKQSAQDYNEEKVEKLKQALLDSLRHASNMGHVDSSEWITIHITGAGQPIIEIIGDIKTDSTTDDVVVGLSISGDVNLDINADQTFMVTKSDPQKGDIETITLNPPKTSEPTYMLIQVQKRAIDRLADDRMSFEEFVEEVTVLIY